jgi:hypothetical protein
MYKTGEPFLPVGPTSKIAAATTAPTAVLLAGDQGPGTMTYAQYRVQNNGSEAAFYAYGVNTTVANTNATIPTNASVGGNCYPLSAGGIEVITAPTGQYWTAITSTANFSVFITPGRGV